MKLDGPIGVFDSGIGGLTVAHAIKKLLPNERLVYFGDTAHLPYGEKSEAAIQAYSIKITDILLEKGCKAIVIACNSASSAAYELLKEYAGKRTLFLNVIDPMVEYILANFQQGTVGLIGTRRTIQSDIYGKRIEAGNPSLHVASLATPLLVPMIEEGFIHNRISEEILESYLDTPEFEHISAMILGCTHYPLIHSDVAAFFPEEVKILDSSDITAEALKRQLTDKQLLASDNLKRLHDEFLVSDFTETFEASSKMFFGEEVHLTKYPLWE
jgi:glutamate racemase